MAVIKISELPSSIDLGNEIENETKSIQFDVSDWDTLFPGYDYHITVKRPGDSGNWPVTGVTHSDGILTWIVPNTVTSVPGQGSFVIHCVKDGKEKNVSCWYFVTDGHEAQGDPPDPVTDWVANATAKLSEVDHFVDETIEATENANTATGLANNAADRADTIAATMEGIAPLWTDAEISVTPLEPYETPTAAITQDENGTHFNFGIPDGRTYFATFEINYETGMLEMTTPDGYDGPVFTYNEETGMLEVTI